MIVSDVKLETSIWAIVFADTGGLKSGIGRPRPALEAGIGRMEYGSELN